MDKVNKQELRRLAEASSEVESWYEHQDFHAGKVTDLELDVVSTADRDFIVSSSPNAILSLLDDLERAESDAERLRMQLAACGVVAMCNTAESAAKARDMHPDYMSASCQDVMRAVDAEMALREELEQYRKDAERWRFYIAEKGEARNLEKLIDWAMAYRAAMAKEGGANA